MRNDAPLVKHLTEKFGVECARQWQRVPYVVLPKELFPREPEDSRQLLESLDLRHLAWDDVILDFGSIFENSRSRGNILMRLHTRMSWSFPWIEDKWRNPLSDALICEVWEQNTTTGSYAPWPDMFALNRTSGPGKSRLALYGYTNGECQTRLRGLFCHVTSCINERVKSHCSKTHKHFELLRILAEIALSYLHQTPSYLVSVRNAKAKSESASKKPWTRRDLSHIILIDPTRVTDYRPARDSHLNGTHASPAPHQRRGHWRRIRIDDPEQRKVFVRPSWVGDTEWEYAGQTYKVVVNNKKS